jgi:hypothetical protein
VGGELSAGVDIGTIRDPVGDAKTQISVRTGAGGSAAIVGGSSTRQADDLSNLDRLREALH